MRPSQPFDEPVDPNDGAPPPYYRYSYPTPPYPGYGYLAPSDRPAGVLASAVLGYVAAGLLLVAALLLFLGASIVTSLDTTASGRDFRDELAVDGGLNMLIAGLLFAGSVVFYSRYSVGSVLMTIAAVLTLGAGIYWASRRPTSGIGFYVAIFVVLPAVALALAWTPEATAWLAGGACR